MVLVVRAGQTMGVEGMTSRHGCAVSCAANGVAQVQAYLWGKHRACLETHSSGHSFCAQSLQPRWQTVTHSLDAACWRVRRVGIDVTGEAECAQKAECVRGNMCKRWIV
eukprot:1154475-Pelagomonas_calceolata.AAC.7